MKVVPHSSLAQPKDAGDVLKRDNVEIKQRNNCPLLVREGSNNSKDVLVTWNGATDLLCIKIQTSKQSVPADKSSVRVTEAINRDATHPTAWVIEPAYCYPTNARSFECIGNAIGCELLIPTHQSE
jgi:hypothetical protein